MSTPIATNTEELRNILQQVNELPSGGGSGTGSGSGSFQRTTGTFTTDTSGAATVTCGFQPDLIVCYLSTYEGSEQGFSIPFAEQSYPSMSYTALGCHYNGMYEVIATRNATGFTFTVRDLGWDYGTSEPYAKNVTIGYTAVKYT